jgi:hypothetical protein
MALTAAELADLTTARSNFVTKLLEISTNPLPTYTIGNQSFSWVEYYRWLSEAIKDLDEQIEADDDDGGAWEVRSTLRT